MPQPVCLTDSTYYPCSRYPHISECLSDFPEVCTISGDSFQFKVVGALCIGEQPVIVFPKNYDLPEEPVFQIAEARNLVRGLLRYKNEMRNEDEESTVFYGQNNVSSNRISTAIGLLEDYCQNGYIKRKSEVASQNYQGRIDWMTTVNKTSPLFSRGMPVYCSPVIRHKTSDDNNIVCLAHKFVINDCFREWGWLFDYDSFSNCEVELPFPAKEVILRLQAELRNTFLEREIFVIKHIIQYLSELTGNEGRRKFDIVATPYFAFVWESICGYLFNNKYPELKTLLPQPVWDSDIVTGNISQRPDIFTVDGDRLYILDAKYYNYHNSIPGWHDAVKQLFYRHTLVAISDTRKYRKYLPNVKDIFNAFILPGNKEDFLYLGRVYVPNINDLGEIKAIAINQKRSLSAYAKRDDDTFLRLVQQRLNAVFDT